MPSRCRILGIKPLTAPSAAHLAVIAPPGSQHLRTLSGQFTAAPPPHRFSGLYHNTRTVVNPKKTKKHAALAARSIDDRVFPYMRPPAVIFRRDTRPGVAADTTGAQCLSVLNGIASTLSEAEGCVAIRNPI